MSERARALLKWATKAVFSLVWSLPFALVLVLAVPAGRLITRARRRRGARPRVVWGTFALPDTAYMAKADRLQGYDARLLVWETSFYNRDWEVPAHVRRFGRIYRVLVLPRFIGFVWSLLRFDVFQYHFDQLQLEGTLWRGAELPLLRLAGKLIIMRPYGADVVLPGTRAYGGQDFHELVARDYPLTRSAWWLRRVRGNIERGCRWASCVVTCVPYLDVIPRSDLRRQYVGIDASEWTWAEPANGRVITVVHASNHRHNKGTDIIERVCRELEAEGQPLRFRLVERTAREEAKAIFASADVIVEQLLAGNIGMFGLEAMALGKPVVAYLREDILEHHPWMAECPIVNANPTTLRQKLLELIADGELRLRLGRAGTAYVRRYHSLEAIGAFSAALYRSLWLGTALPPRTPGAPPGGARLVEAAKQLAS